jgi:hypothetical protein
VTERYKLTCERPNGTVLETRFAKVGRGGTLTADLTTCASKF